MIMLFLVVSCSRTDELTHNNKQKENLVPEENLGIFKCRILIDGTPAKEFNLYLADIITDENGIEVMTRFDRTSLLRASPDNDGIYIIEKVPPGRYGLIADFISHAISLENPSDGMTILVTIKENEVLDLGLLEFSNFD